MRIVIITRNNDMADYDRLLEKAEDKSYKAYKNSDLRQMFVSDHDFLAHKSGFRDGVEFGKQYANRFSVDPKLRLQIAAMAMQGMLGGSSLIKVNGSLLEKSPDNVARISLAYADALIAESQKPREK